MGVYRSALAFIDMARDIIGALPRGKSGLADQLERAASSIALNVAEGAGEFSAKEKARFYRMALHSAAECSAILDVGRRFLVISETRETNGKALLGEIAAQLVGMIRHVERRPHDRGSSWSS